MTSRLLFEGWEERIYRPLAGFFAPSSRHVVLPKTRVVELGEGHVIVDIGNADKGFGTKIEFTVRPYAPLIDLSLRMWLRRVCDQACILALGSSHDVRVLRDDSRLLTNMLISVRTAVPHELNLDRPGDVQAGVPGPAGQGGRRAEHRVRGLLSRL